MPRQARHIRQRWPSAKLLRSLHARERRASETDLSKLLFSVISFAEIGVEAAIGKLDVPDDLRDRVIGPS